MEESLIMSQVNISPNDFCVCYYGTFHNPELVTHINRSWQENFDLPVVNFCVDTSTPDLYFNLWKCSVTKMDMELTTKKFFRVVIAINLDDTVIINQFTEKTQSQLFIRAKELLNIKPDTVYYCLGELVEKYKTTMNPVIFYADSSTFSIAANYGLVKSTVAKENDLHLSNSPMNSIKDRLMNDHTYFYNFLKNYKLKTECVNYENRGMFKRST